MSAVGGEGVAIEHACEAVNWSGCDPEAEVKGGFARTLAAEGWSVQLDISHPDHAGPLLGLACDQPGEVRRRTRKHLAAETGELHSDLGIVEPRIDFAIEHLDDPGRRTRRGTNSVRRAGLVARHELPNG